MVRGSLTFSKCEDLLNALNTVIERINKGDTCLKKVVRIKNKFLVNKREFDQETEINSSKYSNDEIVERKNSREYLYNYSDITIYIAMELDNEKHGLVVELQFLVCGVFCVFCCC